MAHAANVNCKFSLKENEKTNAHMLHFSFRYHQQVLISNVYLKWSNAQAKNNKNDPLECRNNKNNTLWFSEC